MKWRKRQRRYAHTGRKREMMKCRHKKEKIIEYRRVKAVLVECPDCLDMRIVALCECCGQGEAIHIHQTEHQHSDEEDGWMGLCEACHRDFKRKVS